MDDTKQPSDNHPAVKPDILVNSGALQLALNSLKRGTPIQQEIAAELQATATPLHVWQAQIMNNLNKIAQQVPNQLTQGFGNTAIGVNNQSSRQLITVRIDPVETAKGIYSSDVDSRAYIGDIPLVGKDNGGNLYHLGQISSSVSWAKSDMVNHFSKEYDEFFPQGWDVVFEISTKLS